MTTEPVTAVQPSLGRLGPTSGPGGQAARAVLRRLEIARRYGLPRRFLSSRFAPCGAVRVGLPSNRSLSENFTALGEPRTCARGCRRSSRTYPQFRCTGLTPSCAQDLGRQQGACGRQQPRGAAPVAGGATASHGPAAWRSGPGALPLAGRRVVGWTVFLEEVPPLCYPVIPQRGERLQASRDAEATLSRSAPRQRFPGSTPRPG